MPFNYPSTAVKSKRSQSALEYMMTYGWAILIIVIVAVILYSMGIFNPSSSISATVTGFSGLGSVTAQCTANGVLRIRVGDSTGNLINITGITAKDPAITKISNFKPNSTVDPNPLIRSGSSYIFSVPNICPSAGTHYAITVAVNYTEPGQSLPGPYQSLGSITGTVSSNSLPSTVGEFNFGDYISANVKGIPIKHDPRTEVVWFNDANASSSDDIVSYSDSTCITDGGEFFELNVGQAVDNLEVNAWCTNQAIPYTIKNNKWYLGAFVYNGTWQFGYLGANGKIYSVDAAYNESAVATPYYIGHGSDGTDWWEGMIANVQFYNSSLTESQILSLYNEGPAGAPLSGLNLLAWWPLNGSAKDYSGNNNNGVASNVIYTSNYQTTSS